MSGAGFLSPYGRQVLRTAVSGVALFVAALAFVVVGSKAADPSSEIQVWFSPKGGCTDALVKGIGEAKHSIRMSAYEFTSDPIRDALVSACKRGVSVELVMDYRAHYTRHDDADMVAKAGGEVLIDHVHNIHHNKIIVIDSRIVFTGSFNFSDNAEHRNAENLLRIEDAKLARKYLDNFKAHKSHSDEE